MSTLHAYRRISPEADPPYDHAPYASTHRRAPHKSPIRIAHTLSEVTGPRNGPDIAGPDDVDLTRHAGGEALGERIVVSGRVLDEDGRAITGALLEIWQANSAGRYAHDIDQHEAPLDPHFLGVGCVATDSEGAYHFTTIKPGAYPWRNHHNAWRPQHIHFGLFGPGFATRLITQMYFPGDPLLRFDPIFQSVPDAAARERLICSFDIDTTIPERALGYRFDIVLRGRDSTPMDREAGGRAG
jgi:protocatechuate 3,4-dioxygenase beta subunit